jgi:hypothetical protein
VVGELTFRHWSNGGIRLPNLWHGPNRWAGWLPIFCRITDGVLAEQWDVLHDEATRAESKCGLPVFGDPWRQ